MDELHVFFGALDSYRNEAKTSESFIFAYKKVIQTILDGSFVYFEFQDLFQLSIFKTGEA